MRALVSLTRPVWWLPAALLVAATSGCVTTPGFVRVSEIVGEDVDDLSPASLALAADRTAEALKRTKADSFHVEGGRELRVDAMIASARRVADLARDADDSKDLTRRLARACRGWPVGAPAKVTGYYEPVVDARETPDSRFRYPIYAAPGAERLRAISEKLGHAAARADIDGEAALAGLGLELAWLDDPVARFFLHVQGSGVLRYGDGRERRVGFAASNDLPYRSVGAIMLEKGLLERGNASATAMKAWLAAHPDRRDALLEQNPRYIFFRMTEAEGAVGSLGATLVPGRSVATDERHAPRGVLTLLRTTRPIVGSDGKLLEKKPMLRFAFAQDSGAAIQGPARVDLFVGSGEEAGLEAGAMNEGGEVYVLVCEPRPADGTSGGPILGPYGAPYGRRL